MRVCRAAAAAIALTFATLPRGADAQQTTLWLDANASHARPPANVTAEPASYGLLGARLRVDATGGGSFELGAHGGRGAETGAGTWGSGTAAGEISRVAGIVSYGGRAEGFALRYFGGGDARSETRQTVAVGSLRPHLGLSVARFLLRLEGDFTRGAWRLESERTLLPQGPGGLLGGGGGGSPTVVDSTLDGDIAVSGATLSLTRVLGSATLLLAAERHNAENQLADGTYEGAGATVAWTSGKVDFSTGVRAWRSPEPGGETLTETGFHFGVGAELSDAAYARFALTRSVADPVYGTAGSLGVSVGVSLRVGGGGAARAPVAQVGDATSGGRRVVFRFRDAAAQRVAVAGDFSGWEPRELRREGDQWTLEVVLAPGVYHYSFIVNGSEWTLPEGATGVVDDGFGRKNATVVVHE